MMERPAATPFSILAHKSLRPGACKRGPGGESWAYFPPPMQVSTFFGVQTSSPV